MQARASLLLNALGFALDLLLLRPFAFAARRRPGVSGAAMRVHLALQRQRRQLSGDGDEGPVPADLERLRLDFGWRQRRRWDEALLAYQQARREPQPDSVLIAAHLDHLLVLMQQH